MPEPTTNHQQAIRIDIVSDVVCPWCLIGYKQLESALIELNLPADIHWQPFELNPDMSADGENLQAHIKRKYGLNSAESDANRERLVKVGTELGINFDMNDESRMVNTFKAHQLLHWAALNEREHQLKMTLFMCHFCRARDVSDDEVLANACVEAGLPFEEALQVLETELYADAVRERQRYSIASGISGVPAMIFNQNQLHVGAQGTETYKTILKQLG